MSSKDNQVEFATNPTQETNSQDHENKMLDSRKFRTNFDNTRIILGVPRDFLFPKVQPPVTPQKSTVHFVNNK